MRLTFALLVLAASACTNSPSSPTAVPATTAVAAPAPLHHNIPATFAGHPEGPIVYLCATQLRSYTTPDGRVSVEEDHYLQYEPCPSVPIE